MNLVTRSSSLVASSLSEVGENVQLLSVVSVTGSPEGMLTGSPSPPPPLSKEAGPLRELPALTDEELPEPQGRDHFVVSCLRAGAARLRHYFPSQVICCGRKVPCCGSPAADENLEAIPMSNLRKVLEQVKKHTAIDPDNATVKRSRHLTAISLKAGVRVMEAAKNAPALGETNILAAFPSLHRQFTPAEPVLQHWDNDSDTSTDNEADEVDEPEVSDKTELLTQQKANPIKVITEQKAGKEQEGAFCEVELFIPLSFPPQTYEAWAISVEAGCNYTLILTEGDFVEVSELVEGDISTKKGVKAYHQFYGTPASELVRLTTRQKSRPTPGRPNIGDVDLLVKREHFTQARVNMVFQHAN